MSVPPSPDPQRAAGSFRKNKARGNISSLLWQPEPSRNHGNSLFVSCGCAWGVGVGPGWGALGLLRGQEPPKEEDGAWAFPAPCKGLDMVGLEGQWARGQQGQGEAGAG